MLVLVVIFILLLLIEASLVGTTAFVLFGRKNLHGRNKKAIIFMFAYFAILDIMLYTALSILDLEITIGNTQVAELLVPTGSHYVLTFQWFDVVIWAVQVYAGYLIGRWIVNKFRPIAAKEIDSV